MANRTLAWLRLAHQRLSTAPFATASAAVAGLGAMQGQEYLAARWAVGVRCAGLDEAAVEQALAEGSVVRTWAMRGTLQLLAAADARWMVDLVGPPALARHAPAMRRLGVDDAAYAAAEQVLLPSLRRRPLTRPEVFAALEARGLSTAGQRGYYLLVQAGLRGRLCLGPRRGKQETYTLLEPWAPKAKPMARDHALVELARRYFTSHGPATLADFVWWAGLSRTDARAGLAGAEAGLAQQTIEGEAYWGPPGSPPAPSDEAYLLPAFDEYVLGYADRTHVLRPQYSPRVLSKNGIFYPTLVSAGEVIGTWQRTLKKNSVVITLSPFARLTRAQRQAAGAAAERYAAFLGLQPVVAEA
jgi:hypothetical protein